MPMRFAYYDGVAISQLALHQYRGGSGNLKMVRPLTDNDFNGGALARCNIKLYTV